MTKFQHLSRRFSMTIMAVALGFTPLAAISQASPQNSKPLTSKEIIARAPRLIVMLDNSGSSPATEQGFVAGAWPIIETAIRAMPPGTILIVMSVGDAALPPLDKRTRLQQRTDSEGASVDDAVAATRELVLSFPAKTKGNEHGNSQIIGAFYDAARIINPLSNDNQIIALTDLIEYSPLANCYRDCRLPAAKYKLPGTKVVVLGAGRNLDSKKQMALFAAWDKHFEKIDVKADLRKIF